MADTPQMRAANRRQRIKEMVLPEVETRLADLLFDRRETNRIASAMKVEQQDARLAEQRRVEALLAQDRADAAAEQFRQEARTRFECGDSASSADAVIPPTREWAGKGNVESYLPRQDPNSTKIVRTVRRMQVPEARKMMLAGKIDFEGLRACIWYAELFENTGLSGSIPSVDYGREVFSAPNGRLVFTEFQIIAQENFRLVRSAIKPRWLVLLDAMVLDGLPYSKAAKVARMRVGTVPANFGLAVEELCNARKSLD